MLLIRSAIPPELPRMIFIESSARICQNLILLALEVTISLLQLQLHLLAHSLQYSRTAPTKLMSWPHYFEDGPKARRHRERSELFRGFAVNVLRALHYTPPPFFSSSESHVRSMLFWYIVLAAG
jgi:hypothetical protein